MKQPAVSLALLMCFVFSSLVMDLFRPAFTTQLAPTDLLTMASRIRAKESCTCLFVTNQDPSYCDAWTKDISLNADYEVDTKAKKVYSWYTFPIVSTQTQIQTASFISQKRGCLLNIID